MRIKKISLTIVSLVMTLLMLFFSFDISSVAAAPRKNKYVTKNVKKTERSRKIFTEPFVLIPELIPEEVTEEITEDSEEITEDPEEITEDPEEATEDPEEATEDPEEVTEVIEESVSIISKYYVSFESGKLGSEWNKEYASKKYASQIVETTACEGTKAWRAELRKSDPMVYGGKRAEITLDDENPLEEHWYSVSVYLPSSAEEDYIEDEAPEIIMQWHNVPDPGEEWTSPPLSLWTMDGKYYISRYWDDDPITTTEKMNREGKHSFHDLGSYENDKGKWVDWDFHVKWGWLESQAPILEVYKDGEKVLDCNGLPNTTNDRSGVYMKVGIYKWEWNDDSYPTATTRRVVYYDKVQIDDVVRL